MRLVVFPDGKNYYSFHLLIVFDNWDASIGPLFPVSPGYGLKTLDLSDQEDAFSPLRQANIVNLNFVESQIWICGKRL